MRLGFQDDPDFIYRSLSTLNAEAVRHCKAGDHIAAVAAFCKLFERARVKNLIHPEMHVCYRLVDVLQPHDSNMISFRQVQHQCRDMHAVKLPALVAMLI